MALVKKSTAAFQSTLVNEGKSSAVASREAEAQRKKARTLAKQQQAAERVAAATGQFSAGINEAASAAEELKRSTDQIAAGAEEASGAAQESLAAFKQVGVGKRADQFIIILDIDRVFSAEDVEMVREMGSPKVANY